MAIDKPFEKIRQIASEESSDFFGTALQVVGLALPLFKIIAIAKSVLDKQLKGNPTKAAVFALCEEMERLESLWPSDLDAALDSQWLRRAVAVLMDEANRSADEDYARLLGRVAAHGCLPTGPDAHRREDLASYIRDLARLGEDDIRFLKLLRDAYQRVTVGHYDGYLGYHDSYKTKAREAGFEDDDQIALGTRLGGFGLAYEPPIQPSKGQYFVRPTKRGLYLLSLLDAAELPVAKQN
jgi:hypothetical protein